MQQLELKEVESYTIQPLNEVECEITISPIKGDLIILRLNITEFESIISTFKGMIAKYNKGKKNKIKC